MLTSGERRLARITGGVVAFLLFWVFYVEPTIQGIGEAREGIVRTDTSLQAEKSLLESDRAMERHWKRIAPNLGLGKHRFEQRLHADLRQALSVDPRLDKPTGGRSKDKHYELMKYGVSFRRVELGAICRLLALLDVEPVLLGLPTLSIKSGNGRDFNLSLDIETAFLPGHKGRSNGSIPVAKVTEDLEKLVERIRTENLFAPFRAQSATPSAAAPKPGVQPVEREVRERFVLVGVFYDPEEKKYKALLEDTKGGSRVVTEGDELGAVRVEGVGWDGITLVGENGEDDIFLGESFAGSVVGTEWVTPGAGSSASGGPGPESPKKPGGTGKKLPEVSKDRRAEILRKMKEQRRKSLEK